MMLDTGDVTPGLGDKDLAYKVCYSFETIQEICLLA